MMRRLFAVRAWRLERRALWIALAVHLLLILPIFLTGNLEDRDFDRFWEIGSAHGRPYVDYQVERAPAEVAVLKGLAAIAGDRRSFGTALAALNFAADTAIVLVLAVEWGTAAAAFYAVVSIPLLNLVYQRIDLWSVLAATLAVAALHRHRRVAAALSVAAGAALKLWPIVFLPLLWNVRDDRRVAARLALVSATAAMVVLGFALAGSSSVLQVLTFRGARGWQIESLVGNLIELSGDPTRVEAGAFRTGWSAGWLALAMFAMGTLPAIWSMWRGARTERVGTAWLAAVGTLLVFSALFSTQFNAWLIPAAAIAWTEGDRRSAVLTATIVALSATFFAAYGSVVHGVTLAVLIVTVRNALLVVMAVMAMMLLARADTLGIHTTDGKERLVESLRARPPRRIFLIAPSFVGDAVMATGAVRSVIDRFPDAHFTLETTRRSMGVFDNFPGIHARRERFERFEKLTSVVWLRTTKRRFDLAILLDNSRRRAKVARWGGIARVVGIREDDDESWLTASVRLEEQGHCNFDPLRGVMALLDADEDISPRLYPDDHARSAASRALVPLAGRRPLGLFVDAGREAKRWPLDRFLDLADRLKRAGVDVLAVAGVGGEALLEPFRARGVQTLDTIARPLALAEFIRGLAGLVTNDTGPAHLAGAVGTPAVVIYGPTSPARFAPYGTGHQLVHAGFACDHYLRRCDGEAETGACDRRCMNAITVDRVFEAAMAIAKESSVVSQ